MPETDRELDLFFEQLAEKVDLQQMEKHLPQEQQQPEQSREERGFGEHELVVPGVGK